MSQRKKDIGIVGRVRGRVGDFAELTGEKTGEAKLKTERYIEENPWKSVAITAGIGALVGAVVALGVNVLVRRRQPTISERIRSRVRDLL